MMLEASLDHSASCSRRWHFVAGTDAGWRFTPIDGCPKNSS